MHIKLRSPVFLAYFSTAAFAILFFVYVPWGALPTEGDFTSLARYYAVLTFEPLLPALGAIVLGSVIVLLGRTMWLLCAAGLRGEPPAALIPRARAASAARAFARECGDFFRLAFPVVISLLLQAYIVGAVSEASRSRLVDETLLQWDRVLTGGDPFILLQSFPYPGWFEWSVIASYAGLGAALIIFAVYCFHSYRDIFKEFAAAFTVCSLIMLAVWIAAPALGPQIRFIDNVYNLPIPASVGVALENYRPDGRVRAFQEEIMKTVGKSSNAPISTMPSAHVAWALLAGWYAFRASRKIAVVFAPFLILSSFGTVFLAQHYLVDIPAGIAAGALAILAVHYYIIRKDSTEIN